MTTKFHVSSTTLLGVHFDRYQSWNQHISHIRKKVACNLRLFKKLKSFLPLAARKLFFNSYALPHFDYCSTIGETVLKQKQRNLQLYSKELLN